jgi:superfamily II DNA or RNA helicase
MIDAQVPIEIDQLDLILKQEMPAEWLRGKAYYQNGRISDLSFAMMVDGNWSVRGDVKAADTYTVRLIFSANWGQLSSWRCSCPQMQRLPCRHAVAVTLQALHKNRPDRLLFSRLINDPETPGAPLKANVQVFFRYQKSNNRILLMPRLTKRDATGRKLMTANPLDPEDINISISVSDRMTLLRERTAEQCVIDFFSHWAEYRHLVPGSLSFDADWDLPLLVSDLLPSIPADWQIFYDREFEKIIPRKKAVMVDFSNLRKNSVGLMSFDLQFHCDQLSISPQQLEDYLLGQQRWLLLNGEFVEVTNASQLRALLEQLSQLQQSLPEDGRITADAVTIASMLCNDSGSAGGDSGQPIQYDESISAFRAGLAAQIMIHDDQVPSRLSQLLRPYQRLGVEWLLFLSRHQLGGILADEMGLGKTLQVLTAVAIKKRTRPTLIVCPKTLLFNWQNEARRFTPDLKTVVVHGSQSARNRLLKQAAEFDLLITSYPLLQRDIGHFSQITFDCCILDEAQMIKNPETHLARHVKKINAHQRIALTGTPMENSLMDLWSIFDFILPGYLGHHDAFRVRYEQGGHESLLNRIRPFILRRTKADVLSELPAKVEETIYASLTQNQLAQYQQVLTQVRKSISDEIQLRGSGQQRIAVLAGLTRLRQICNHPGLLEDDYRFIHGLSGKLELFDDLLQSLLANGHKVLVFSQFTQMLAILTHRLQERMIAFSYLDGQTRDRQQVIQRFNRDGQVSVFLISLKAGGFGLNLTAADTVILFDPWWNPMVENQAADRAHRFGQSRVVTVYRLITQNTIEEKMVILQERKRLAFDQIIGKSGEGTASVVSLEELMALLD